MVLFELPSKLLEIIYKIDFDVHDTQQRDITEKHKQMVNNLVKLQYVKIPYVGILCVKCSEFQMEQDDDQHEFVDMDFHIKHYPSGVEEFNILIKLYFAKCCECNFYLSKIVDPVLSSIII